MKILGIVPAKSKSYRFPGKNKILFKDNVLAMKDSRQFDDIIVASDDFYILHDSKYKLKVGTWERSLVEIELNLPLIDVLKQVYLAQNKSYTHIICVFGCTYGLISESISSMVAKMASDNSLKEVRSFDLNGFENGMFMLTVDRLLEGHISSYIGCVHSSMAEIHTEDQL